MLLLDILHKLAQRTLSLTVIFEISTQIFTVVEIFLAKPDVSCVNARY